jgi:hypothetical protein
VSSKIPDIGKLSNAELLKRLSYRLEICQGRRLPGREQRLNAKDAQKLKIQDGAGRHFEFCYLS